MLNIGSSCTVLRSTDRRRMARRRAACVCTRCGHSGGKKRKKRVFEFLARAVADDADDQDDDDVDLRDNDDDASRDQQKVTRGQAEAASIASSVYLPVYPITTCSQR